MHIMHMFATVTPCQLATLLFFNPSYRIDKFTLYIYLFFDHFKCWLLYVKLNKTKMHKMINTLNERHYNMLMVMTATP